jgi:hypothetical protein
MAGKEADDLLHFVSGITGDARLRIEENLPHGFVRLKVAEAERRQAQHDIRCVEDIVCELVRNSRDAGARRAFVGFQKERGKFRRITVLDDGCGIPGDMHDIVFEPRVTSKSKDFEEDRFGVHGRGMALFSIRSRAPDASVLFSEAGVGTVMQLTVDTDSVPERSDQATIPSLHTIEGNLEVGAGPHNVARTLLEISVDSPGLELYLGSFAEVLSTLLTLDDSGPAPWSALSEDCDARGLSRIAVTVLGLPVSERNSYRILNREVSLLQTMVEIASNKQSDIRPDQSPQPAPRPKQTGQRRRSPLRVVKGEDLQAIGDLAASAATSVLEQYYMRPAGSPTVRRSRGRVVISFHVCEIEDEEE